MTKNSSYSTRFWGCILTALIPFSASAQGVDHAGAAVPPPRTITAEPLPAAPKRVVFIHYFDEAKGDCIDAFKLESSRVRAYKGQTVTFRTEITRKCGDKSLKAPVPQSAVFSVRSEGGKKNTAETIKPDRSSFSFSHTFESAGNYQVAVVCRISDDETHTVSLPLTVHPPKVNVPAPENTD